MHPTLRNACIIALLLAVVFIDFASKALSVMVDGMLVTFIIAMLYFSFRDKKSKN